MNRRHAFDILMKLDDEIGRGWFRHARAAGAADDVLRVVMADGMFTTKIDGWVHAANVTTKSIMRFAGEGELPQLDLADVTAWSGGNAAYRYGRWQTDFHWKIDTRLWQYVLYLKFMRDAYRDAIDASTELGVAERADLQRVVTEFFDQAEIALVYRWEVIERSRGFALHPDSTAGAATHGYSYEQLRPLPLPAFADLPLDLVAEREGAAREGDRDPVPPFPRLDGCVAKGLASVAQTWLASAQQRGIADRWLSVKLGDRMVPTRFNGWEAGVSLTLPLLISARGGDPARVEVNGAPARLGGLDLTNQDVRFGLCQAVFQQRLRGGSEELLALLAALRQALIAHASSGAPLDGLPAIDRSRVESLFASAATAALAAFAGDLDIDEAWLPELGGRPIHPRFAPYDPVEPLPWESRSPDLYARRMERLGYVI
ncbi:MAG: hypothetical protein KGM44_07525 [bacterium]|nr:hypothetical protein [bacterium]